jgi:hypothetical protein
MKYASFASSLLVTLPLACAPFQKPLLSPDHGGAAWTELTSAHFVLKTDLGPEDAKRASSKLEDTYAALSDLGFESADKPKTRIDVVYFRRRESYLAFEPPSTSAKFFAAGLNDFERRPMALLGGAFDDSVRTNVQHELTHLFVHYYYPQAPLWLNEGLARYYETLSVDGGSAMVGRAPTGARFWKGPPRRGPGGTLLIPIRSAPSVAQLRVMKFDEFYAKPGLDFRMPEGRAALLAQTANYQGAWCLVHLLLENPSYSDAFRAYLDRLRAGDAEKVAWDATVGRDDDSLDKDYAAALSPDEVTALRIAYTPPARPAPESVRPIADPEVNALWARLRDWRTPEGRRQVEADLAEASRAPRDPEVAMVSALWADYTGQRGPAEQGLRDAAATHPDDPRLWSALGWLALGGRSPGAVPRELGATLAPITAKLEPIAKTAAELDLLGHASLIEGKPDAALGYEKRAVALDPNCIDCLGWAATAMLEKGLGREALEVATLAQGLSPEGVRPPWLATLIRRARGLSSVPGDAGCFALRGPLAALTGIVEHMHDLREGRSETPVNLGYGKTVLARLRALDPHPGSPAAADGAERAMAYLARILGELPPVAKEALAKDEDDGRALLADASAACHMPSLTRGRLDTGGVKSVIQEPGLFAQCDWKGATPDVVMMQVVVEQDGNVSSTYPLSSSIRDPAFLACLADVFEGTPFPKPEGGIGLVTIPLRFAPPTEVKPPTAK